MNKIYRLFLAGCLCILCSCGYHVQGLSPKAGESVFGSGSKTVAIAKIEDPSLYPWINYYLTNQFHSEMNARKLARFITDKSKADFLMEILLHRLYTADSLTDEQDRTILNTIYITMEVRLKNAETNEIWSSGLLTSSQTFQRVSEEQAVNEVLQELVYRAFNAMENTF